MNFSAMDDSVASASLSTSSSSDVGGKDFLSLLHNLRSKSKTDANQGLKILAGILANDKDNDSLIKVRFIDT